VQVELTTVRGSDRPLYLQIADGIARLIASGDLAPGDRLPTVRALARQLSVTRVTVHNAYSHLQAGGLTESTVGRGTFVAGSGEANASSAGRPAPWYGPVDMGLQLLRGGEVDSFALAEPDPDLAPAEAFMGILREISDPAASLLRYGATEGDPKLREQIAVRLRRRGVEVDPEEILITTGSTQALSLVAQCLARPGDRVLVEQPTYFGFLSTLKVHDIQPLGVPMDHEGPDPEALERLIVRERPRFLYTMPSFHNPTGVTMSDARRRAVRDLSVRYSLPVVEDDIFHSLSYGKGGEAPGRPMKADDERGLVYYVDSFSKSLLPGLRIGYMIAPTAHRPRIAALHYAATLGNAHILQRALAVFLESGGYDAHLKKVIPLYRKRRDALMKALKKEMPEGTSWTTPEGGFCCWVTLPAGLSSEEVFRLSMDRGVTFAPGHLFEAQPRSQPRLRLCFGSLSPERIRDAIGVLGQIVRMVGERVRPRHLQPRSAAPLV
jgi:DNA-binding transcriptional MocR family regulator